MAVGGLGDPRGWTLFDDGWLSGTGASGAGEVAGDHLPSGVQTIAELPASAFGLAPDAIEASRAKKFPGFLTFDEIESLDIELAAKGGTKGKPADTDSTGSGNGWGSGGKGKSDGGTDTGTDTGGGTSGGDGGGVVVTDYLSGGDASTSYNVEISFGGTWSSVLQQAFIDAADFLSSIILGDLPNALGSTGGVIDDIRIEAWLVDIDGAGGILGQAGPTEVRTDSWLPTEGVMEFDIADAQRYLDNGTWYDIVLHEMIHSIGFGTVWDHMGLLTGSIENGDLRFIGENAIEAYLSDFDWVAKDDSGALLGVPVETHGGAGTAGGHWDETRFGNELLTGYLNSSNYVSDMTIAALEDMGYDTVYDGVLIA